jgi:hypothetical protein
MNLKEAREFYYYYSEAASDVSRKLNFAGLALIWLFKINDNGQDHIPSELLFPCTLIILSLSFDILQYIYGTAAWGIFSRQKEKEGNDEFKAPRVINWPSLLCFWIKTSMIPVAYLFLFYHIVIAYYK